MYSMHIKDRFHHMQACEMHPVHWFMENCSHNPRFVSAIVIMALIGMMVALVTVGLIFGQGANSSEIPYTPYLYPYIYP